VLRGYAKLPPIRSFSAAGRYDRRNRTLRKSMQIELYKTVAGKPSMVFNTVADIDGEIDS
jgi:hypothetical protein